MYDSKRTYVLLQQYHYSLFSSSTALHVILRISAVSLLAIISAKFGGQSKLSSAHLFLKSVLTPSEVLHSITFWTGVSTIPHNRCTHRPAPSQNSAGKSQKPHGLIKDMSPRLFTIRCFHLILLSIDGIVAFMRIFLSLPDPIPLAIHLEIVDLFLWLWLALVFS